MKPLTLTITAFGPYLARQVIDLERLGEHGLFLIHGRTGSGKSTILDALCFALFGKTTGGEREGQDMVTTLDPGAETKVVLEFEHGGARYRVTRYPTQEVAKVRGVGLRARPTEATLEDLSAGEVLADRARDVNAAVEEMLRCDVAQFRQTVVLPQGDFRRVVTDDGSRREILARIFRTERFAELAERLKEYAKGLAHQGRAIREERERVLAELGASTRADVEASLAAARSALDAAVASRSAAGAATDAALEARAFGVGLYEDFTQLERLTLRAAQLRDDAQRMSSLASVVERATRAAALRDSRDHLDQRVEEHARLREAHAAAEAAAATARDDLSTSRGSLAELEAAERAALQGAEARFTQLNGQRENVAGLSGKQRTKDVLTEELAVARAKHGAATSATETLRATIAALEEEAASLARLAADVQAAVDQQAQARADLDAQTELAGLLRSVEELDAFIEAARAVDASARLEAAVTANAPGLLARTLVAGSPCPVCGSAHHPAPSSSHDIEALTLAFADFGRAAAHVAGLVERRAGHVTAMETVRGRRGWAEPPPPRAELEAASRAAAERVAAVEGARARGAEIAAAIAEARADLGSSQAEQAALAEELGRLQGGISRLEGESLEESRVLAQRLQQRFAAATEAVSLATIADAKASATALGRGGQVTTAAEALERTAQEFGSRLTTLGFEDRSDFESAELDPDELASHRSVLDAFDNEVRSVAAEKDALSRKLEGVARPDLEALESALLAAQARASEAQAAAAHAERLHDDIERGHERLTELEGRDARLAERRAAAVKLDQLANGQLAGRSKVKLETFVLQSIFHEVLDEGNRHLRHMTGGRYTLVLRESTGASGSGLELDVRDNAAGTDTRPVTTLSGGEGFLASLSLALGLSEVAQRRSGGLELGALFIDEGFGSLDSQALDQVVDILRGLHDGRRMVGVISHVEELKRRIPAQLHVEQGRSGSTVELVLNA